MLALCFFIQSIFANSFVLSGQLVEKGTKKPLGQVNIFVLPHKFKTTTDELGNYKFTDVPPGAAKLVVNQAGYYRLDKEINIEQDRSEMRLFLERKRYDYFETTVVAKAKKRDNTSRSLGQKDFLTAPGAGKDPVKAVQNLPGVNRSAAGGAQIVIQGSDPDDTRYLIDGHEIPLVFHFGGLTSVVTPEAIDSVEFLSAGYGPEYGKAIGGLIQLNTRSPNKDRWQGFSFFDNFNAGGLIEGPVSESSELLVSARYAYIGPVLKEVLKDNEDFNLSVAPTFWDITSVYNYRINETSRLKWVFLSSQDKLEFIINEPINNDPSLRGDFFQKTEFSRLITTYSKKYNERSQSNLSVAIGNDTITVEFFDRFFEISSDSLSLLGEYQRSWTPKWTSFFGFDNQFSTFDLDLKLQRTSNQGGVSDPLSSGDDVVLKNKGSIDQLGLYWRNDIKALESLTISPNLRYDSFNRTKNEILQPRLAFKYEQSKSLFYKGAVGLYYQEAEPAESSAGFGNPDLKALRAVHYFLGFEKDFRGGRSTGWTLGNNYFLKELSDLISESSRIVIRDGELVTENYRNGESGRVQGAELEVNYTLQDMNLKLAYTYLRSRRKSIGIAEHPAAFDQTHSLNLLGKKDWDRWILSARLRYVTGNPETPVVGAVYDADNDTYLPVRGPLYSTRRPDFFQFDVRVDRKWVFETWIMSAYLDIQNLFNTQNVEDRQYSFDYSESQDVMGLPVLPSFGLKGEF